MNRLKVAMHPVSFIRSFLLLEGFMNLMALTLVGLASMPRLLTMKPGSFPDGTPNTHLVGLSFHLNFLRFENVSERSVNHITFCLDDDVIDIGLGVVPDLSLEASLNGLLVGCAGILEAECHGVVAVGPEGSDEGGLLLILLFEVYLVVP